MITMSIDPSVKSCGYSIWDNRKLVLFGIQKGKHPDNWQASGMSIGYELHKLAKNLDVQETYCEYPGYFSGGGGLVTASSGALVKLAWFVGFLNGLFTPELIDFILVPVNEWKGQLPKQVVNQRIKKILGEKACQGFEKDIWDAVGIALYKQGRMK